MDGVPGPTRCGAVTRERTSPPVADEEGGGGSGRWVDGSRSTLSRSGQERNERLRRSTPRGSLDFPRTFDRDRPAERVATPRHRYD